MSKTYKHIFLGVLLMLGALPVPAANPELKISDARITVNEAAALLDVELELNLKEFKVGRNIEAVYTPLVISENGKDSVVMKPFTVCGRNRYYWYERDDETATDSERVYRAGSKRKVSLRETLQLQPWMLNNATVEIRQQCATCCSALRNVPGDSKWGNVPVARLKTTKPVLEFQYVFAPPVAQEPVQKHIEGKAFVTFVVNRTELNPNYMDNPAELKKITGSIDFVKDDPDAIITEVHIRGYASPEGRYENNVRLAQGRTETLAAYVNNLYRFKQGIMTTSYDPEDWTGLRAYVADSLGLGLSDREGLLEIIDGNLDFDARDAALRKNFPKDYQILLKEVYPWLRHSDYTVKYNIKVYTELSDLMRLYNTDPTKLRGVDFYTIAQQYPAGSPRYNEVMRKAIQVYPDDPMLNLNMANVALMEGNLDAAQSSLLGAGRSPQADYARGIVAAKRGDFEEAARWFRIALQGGVTQAEAPLRAIEAARNANPVEMLLKN